MRLLNYISILGSSIGEDVGFGDIFFYDKQRHVSNEQTKPYGKFSGN